MKLLLVTDSLLAKSAYAIQSRALARYLQRAGHEVVVYGLSYYGEPITLDETVLMVGQGSLPPNDAMQINQHAARFAVDAILTYKDPFDLRNMRLLEVPWIAVAPVDTEPASLAVLSGLDDASAVITLTRHGQAALKEQGIEAHYAPCGIDTQAFTPGDKGEARRALKLPEDPFIALVVAANQSNPSRKNLDQIILTWEVFHREHPDSLLWLHTDLTPGGGGLNLAMLIDQLGWDKRHYRNTPQNGYATYAMNDAYMATLYRAADVLLLPSGGEGFGVPLVEAQACGTPVIACDYTAMRETAWAGWKIPTDKGGQYGEQVWTQARGAFYFRPSRACLVEYLKAAYAKRGDAAYAEKARAGALAYDLQIVMNDHWLPTMKQIEALLNEGQLEGV